MLVLLQSHVGCEEAATARVLEDDADLVQPSAHSSERPPSPEGESDREGVEGVSEPDPEGEVVEPTAAEETMAFESRPSQFTAAFASLDEIDVEEMFSSRAAVMCSVPFSPSRRFQDNHAHRTH